MVFFKIGKVIIGALADLEVRSSEKIKESSKKNQTREKKHLELNNCKSTILLGLRNNIDVDAYISILAGF